MDPFGSIDLSIEAMEQTPQHHPTFHTEMHGDGGTMMTVVDQATGQVRTVICDVIPCAHGVALRPRMLLLDHAGDDERYVPMGLPSWRT